MVFLPGCGGLLGAKGRLHGRELDWAAHLNAQGLGVLMVDSLTPRAHGQMCSVAGFDKALYAARAQDARAALRWLRAQDFVAPGRVAVMGWSQGGGVVLDTIRAAGAGADRPAARQDGDFAAAVAFYPARCDRRRQGPSWDSPVPLLVLLGADDVWSPAVPCEQLMDATTPGTWVRAHAYPGAVHDFDWPHRPRRELPQYRTRAGVVPVVGTDEAARADAIRRVTAFLAQRLSAGDAAPENEAAGPGGAGAR